MNRVPRWAILITVFMQISGIAVNSETELVRNSLVQFMERISLGKANFGWNSSSDPCTGNWTGIKCDPGSQHVKKIVLDHFNLSGVLDAGSVCAAQNLAVLSLNGNSIFGTLSEDISKCGSLTHLYLHNNSLSGSLPGSVSRLANLKRIVISNNAFSGEFPAELIDIPDLLTLQAENNHFSGEIPKFNFARLVEFNVSYNNFSGPIPDKIGNLSAISFIGNPGLCGGLISKPCPPPPPPPHFEYKKKGLPFLVYLGYVGLGLIVLFLLGFGLIKRFRRKKGETEKTIGRPRESKVRRNNNNSNNSKSEYSITSGESGRVSSSFEILSGPLMGGALRFEELLQAPAEMLGRGKHGSSYKVGIDGGGGVSNLVVKRIRGWDIAKEDFKKRMVRINQVDHPNVLRLVAFYCSRQEKLLVYEYLHNGSLLNLLNEAKKGQILEWGRRLSIAATVSSALAFMHEGLHQDRISHGNLKSSNILINNQKEPCIAEYGLMPVDNASENIIINRIEEDSMYTVFKNDVYSFGVILLELLTGKPVQSRGTDLAKWVNSVVREEWTGEVFDKALVLEGASEERMVSVLKLALNCTNLAHEKRPNMTHIAHMINSIKDEEDRSTALSFDTT